MDIKEIGYIDKKEILNKISEEDIFKIIFKEYPDLTKRYCSPFRNDNNPGCYFYINTSDKLIFFDTGRSRQYDCFDAIKEYYNLDNFYEVLNFIKYEKTFNSNIIKEKTERIIKEKEKNFLFKFKPKDWDNKDKKFWSEYNIKRSQLESDYVFSIEEIILQNTNSGDYIIKYNTPGFCYTEFASGRKKAYFPYLSKKKKFISETKKEDIGGLNHIDFTVNNIIITKSYKDHRVLYNLDYNNIWLQNEGMIPDNLFILIKDFKNIFILFDNDEAGYIASNKLYNEINKRIENINLKDIKLDKYKDPSDYLKKLSENDLKNYLKEHVITRNI